MKTNELSHFRDELLKAKEIDIFLVSKSLNPPFWGAPAEQ
jgi:hypothetical protein